MGGGKETRDSGGGFMTEMGRLWGFWGAVVTLPGAMESEESSWSSARFPGIFQQTLREFFLPDLA